jgi:hypothetical protein
MHRDALIDQGSLQISIEMKGIVERHWLIRCSITMEASLAKINHDSSKTAANTVISQPAALFTTRNASGSLG